MFELKPGLISFFSFFFDIIKELSGSFREKNILK